MLHACQQACACSYLPTFLDRPLKDESSVKGIVSSHPSPWIVNGQSNDVLVDKDKTLYSDDNVGLSSSVQSTPPCT